MLGVPPPAPRSGVPLPDEALDVDTPTATSPLGGVAGGLVTHTLVTKAGVTRFVAPLRRLGIRAVRPFASPPIGALGGRSETPGGSPVSRV